MPDIGAPELIIVLVVVVLLFGAKRLPDLARSSGRSLRIFKSEVKGLADDDHPEIEAPQTDEERIAAAAEAAAKAEAARIEAEKHTQS